MTNAIELNHISKSFGEFSLKDVTLAVPAGTICGLVGENGAGKSTLIRILMGALRPDSGTAAALGVDGILLTPESCDPLNRRAVRVSMGTVFKVAWTWLDRPVSALRELGLKMVALALNDDSVAIDDPGLNAEPRLALVLGTEGDGLSRRVIAEADYVARIPMMHGVDSLNVAAASAVAFWQLRARP